MKFSIPFFGVILLPLLTLPSLSIGQVSNHQPSGSQQISNNHRPSYQSNRRRSDSAKSDEVLKQRIFMNQAHMQFSLDLMASLLIDSFTPETSVLESFAFSPLSLQSTLMMIQLGTKGHARREISNALYLTQMDSENATFTHAHEIYGEAVKSLTEDYQIGKTLSIGNQVFVQKDLIPSSTYELALRQYHNSRLKPIDFTLTTFPDIVNDWIEKETRGNIKNLITSPPSAAILMMGVNALYFKGDWQYRFNSLDTETHARFYKTNKAVDSVTMMVGKMPIGYTYNGELKTTLIELPYKVQRLGMFLLLPDEVSGIFSLMRSLNSTTLTSLIASMRKDQKEGVNVRLPKFQIDFSPRMTNILKNNLGIRTLFSNGEADFSNMFLNAPVGAMHLDEVIHRVHLKLDEKGTVGAAATATVIERVGSFSGSYFEADHPFMYFLTDKQTGLILFAGVYAGQSTDHATSGGGIPNGPVNRPDRMPQTRN